MTERPTGPVVRYCADLLKVAIESVHGEAALFSVDTATDVSFFCATFDASEDDAYGLFESAALETLRTRQAARIDERVGSAGKLTGENAALGVPALLDDEIVAVVVVRSRIDQLISCVQAIRPSIMPLALGVDRYRSQRALESRGSEISSVRKQLDIYAVDVQSTYRAERDRSFQLAAALAELEQTYLATVQGLAIAVEAKDECTGGHLQRVCRYGMMLTKLVAPAHANDPQFEYGFLLHDIGKLTVPDMVLGKPGALDEFEWRLMREHPTSGRSILAGIPFLAHAREIVFAHHERWDGTGYPQGLAGEEIPLGAQIFPLCDAFDAMTSDRPYRAAMSTEAARAEVRKGSGTQFWPQAVEAFLDLPAQEIEAVMATARQGVVL